MSVSDVMSSLTRPVIGILILAATIVVGFAVSSAILWVINRVARRMSDLRMDSFMRHFHRPILYFFPLVGSAVAIGAARTLLHAGLAETLNHIDQILFIAWISWALAKVFFIIEDLVFDRYDVDVRDNLRARKIRTQTRFMKRLGSATIAIIGIGIMLTTFKSVRQLGTTLLASAGVIGIVIGFAAQRALGLVIAGFQVAFTQPIRIDDVVIVENEWGRIEEITLTYVVVRIWDLRRLVLPINYFLDHPFQNWTRVSADLLGTVYLYLDYSVPVEALRAELHRILEASSDWDGKVWNVQVTNATDRCMEVRCMMSASDSPTLWDLRCAVREGMIRFVNERFPETLAFFRTDRRRWRGAAQESIADGPLPADEPLPADGPMPADREAGR